jgi:hypothetical protein
MVHKGRVIGGIILGVLVLLIILVWPLAPLWQKLGLEPFCIQGNIPDLKIVSCSQPITALPAFTSLRLPSPSG